VVAGDFFETMPVGGDVYLLSWIIHDLDDERSITILNNCRRAMALNGKVLIIEQLVPGANQPSMSKLYDLHMLVLTSGGGRERTEAQYRTLLNSAGFRLTNIFPTLVPRSIIEGVHA